MISDVLSERSPDHKGIQVSAREIQQVTKVSARQQNISQ